MKVYIELVILNNLAVTFLIARLSYYFCSLYPQKGRIISASVAGTIAAIFYPFISNAILLVIYKLGCGIAICLLLFPLKKILKGSLFFFLLTFMFGGAMFAVGYLIHGSVEKALTLPFSQLPIFVIIFGAYILFVTAKVLINKLFKYRDVKKFIYKAEIFLFGKAIECQAFLDSGNRLYDDKSGLPIVIATISTLSKILDDDKMTQLITGKPKEFTNAHYVECNTVGGKSKMLVFRPESLVVYNEDKKNIINDVMLGVVFKRMSDVENYGLILNPAVMIGV